MHTTQGGNEFREELKKPGLDTTRSECSDSENEPQRRPCNPGLVSYCVEDVENAHTRTG
jgi:hypothetical protein